MLRIVKINFQLFFKYSFSKRMRAHNLKVQVKHSKLDTRGGFGSNRGQYSHYGISLEDTLVTLRQRQFFKYVWFNYLLINREVRGIRSDTGPSRSLLVKSV